MDAIKFLLGSGDTNDAVRALLIGGALIGWMWWQVGLDFWDWLKER